MLGLLGYFLVGFIVLCLIFIYACMVVSSACSRFEEEFCNTYVDDEY